MKMKSFLFSILASFVFFSCSNKYSSLQRNYQFMSLSGEPHYEQLDYWASHPWKWDPSDSIPKPLLSEAKDSSADVFFIHPTTFTKKRYKDISNASIDDPYINAKTDYTSILYQASVFNRSCRVFAPRYRQAHIHNFFSSDKIAAEKAFALAYEDIKNAFDYYLQRYHTGRPIIIAGHSQGALMAEQLLKDYFENKPLKNKLVAAYILGWPVPTTYFSSLKMCGDSLQTGCLISWRTYRKGYIPPLLKKETVPALATNPLTWSTNGQYASKLLNEGSVLTNFNKVYKHTTDGQLVNGLLYVKKPKFPWSFLYFSRNYHIADINLFYINIRENIQTRIRQYRQ
jgi:pimeloyl-ACP methyl ester carboxylesterase